jgi:hypothetical protein
MLDNLLHLANITTNLPDDDSLKREFMKKEIDWVLDWVMGKSPIIEFEEQDELFEIINNLTGSYYSVLVDYFGKSASSTPKLGTIDQFGLAGISQVMSVPPSLHRGRSVY